MNDTELYEDFNVFQAALIAGDLDTAAGIVSDYVIILSTHPDRFDESLKPNVKILIQRITFNEFGQFAYIIKKLCQTIDNGQYRDFRWMLN